MVSHNSQRATLLSMLMMCALIGAGCAGLPRIDPSGERVFIWPQKQAAVVQPFSTNAQVPPVYTAPVYPAVVPPGPTQPGQGGLAGLLPPVPTDRLTLTPDRILAPVGSEVILKAGLCTSENYLLTDSKIEWLLARDEVGEFVSLGGRGLLRDPLLPWNKAKKIDNQYATGYTATVPLRITRGTADTSDDVQVQPGEAWASITSPVEGTSRITAVAPEITTWAHRRATATIYWVDVQWTFPAAMVSGAGSKVLTTTVRRHTDGTPIVGWLVRYEVADGNSSGVLRGNESGQVVEVLTDAEGKASIDVTPTGSSGTTTIIKTQIVRPERFGGSNAPRLVIANGTSTVNWTDGGSDYLPMPDDLDVSPPSYPVPDAAPTNRTPGAPVTPSAKLGPKIEVEVYTNDKQTVVNNQVRFEVVIKNTGDATATNVVLKDIYDVKKLSFPGAQPGQDLLQQNIGSLTPNQSETVYLGFTVIGVGEINQEYSATYDGCGNGCKTEVRDVRIFAKQPVRQAAGRLEIIEQSLPRQTVGEKARFTLTLKNTGDGPLTDIEIRDLYDNALLLPSPLPFGTEAIPGGLLWKVPYLGAGQTQQFNVECPCVQVSLKACRTIHVSANTGATTGSTTQSAQSCTEILPKASDVGPSVGPAPGGNVLPGVNPLAPGNGVGGNVVPDNNANRPLRMQILLTADRVRVGTRSTLHLSVSNSSNVIDQNVRLRLIFPSELTPDVSAIRNGANVVAQFNASSRELLFTPIQSLRPTEKIQFTIPFNVQQKGVRTIRAQLYSDNMPISQQLEVAEEIQIIDSL